MMYQHYIAITSIYTKGIRMAWHYRAEELDLTVIQAFITAFKKAHGSMNIGLHRLQTDSPEWSSVVESDPFFENVMVTTDYHEFIAHIQADTGLNTFKIMQQFSRHAPI